jgi:hypothetical protein
LFKFVWLSFIYVHLQICKNRSLFTSRGALAKGGDEENKFFKGGELRIFAKINLGRLKHVFLLPYAHNNMELSP